MHTVYIELQIPFILVQVFSLSFDEVMLFYIHTSLMDVCVWMKGKMTIKSEIIWRSMSIDFFWSYLLSFSSLFLCNTQMCTSSVYDACGRGTRKGNYCRMLSRAIMQSNPTRQLTTTTAFEADLNAREPSRSAFTTWY